MSRKSWLDQLRRRLILDPIVNDARSIQGTRLGRQPAWIFTHAIGGGQAEFDEPVEDLSGRDRVMLYALFNQKAHLDELIHAFEKLLPETKLIHEAIVVDIGCGPFTAGLALANVVGQAASFRYMGVDRSVSMCNVGAELAEEVAAIREFHAATTVAFYRSVDAIDFGPRLATGVTVFILSYLLASETLDIDGMVSEIVAARKRASLGPCIVLYTNSAREGARVHFPKFAELMIQAGFELRVEETERFIDTDKPRDIHYALFFQAAVSALPLSDFTR